MDNVEFIAEQEANRLIKHIAYAGEVITTKIGFLGYSTVLPSSYKRYFFRRELTRLVIKDTSQIDPYYLATFLNSSYGRIQASRYSSGTTRDRILLVNQHHMLIPIFSYLFQQFIENIIIKANDLKENSTVLYQQAQDILLAELGLNNWKPAHRLTFIKRYSDTQQAGRTDAEYFQPKYDDIIDAIKAYKGGWDTLGNLCKTKRGSLISESFYNTQSGTPYIRGADFSGGELTADKMIFVNSQFSRKNETFVKENEIVFSLIGSVGETALATKDFNNAYISNNIGKITCKDEISPIVLQALLNSIVGKLYFDKYKT